MRPKKLYICHAWAVWSRDKHLGVWSRDMEVWSRVAHPIQGRVEDCSQESRALAQLGSQGAAKGEVS